jgi:hypothetical protein
MELDLSRRFVHLGVRALESRTDLMVRRIQPGPRATINTASPRCTWGHGTLIKSPKPDLFYVRAAGQMISGCIVLKNGAGLT